MTLTKEKVLPLVLLIALVFALYAAVFLTGNSQDVRPRALLGAANFRLNTERTTVSPGDSFSITVSTEITNSTAKVSGVDFTLLYDNTKLRLISSNVILGTNFTDNPIKLDQAMPYPSEGSGLYNFLRIALISKKPSNILPTGTIPLANLTFQVLSGATGEAMIKFPSDNTVLQVVGSN